MYQRTLQLVAIDLYQNQVLTLGRSATLAGMPLGDFIDLCAGLGVPVMWAPSEGLAAEVDAFVTSVEMPPCESS